MLISRRDRLFLGLSLLALAASPAQCASGKRVLILAQSVEVSSKFSSFLDGLTATGLELDIKAHKDSTLKLREYGAWLYDHLILFTPKAEGFGGTIDSATILDFMDSGRNVLIAVNSDVSETMRNLVAEVGVDLDDKGTKVFDHLSYVSFADGKADHTAFVSRLAVKSAAILGTDSFTEPVLFRGIAQSVAANAELASVVLSAPATAYSHDPRKAILEPPALLVGNGVALVTAVQARNNARVIVSGSLELFSDEFFSGQIWSEGAWKVPANKEFANAVALWAFQQRGVLKASNLRHQILGPAGREDFNPTLYRVDDDVEFAIDIELVTGGVAAPYLADDVQLEFIMLDPHVRLPLQPLGNGTFSLRFKVPDVYGVFKYVINYSHLGYSYVQISHQVPVRPYKHNEYERFLLCAYPYYATAASTMAAFFALGFFFLYTK